MESVSETDDLKLSCNWVIWFHSINNKSWTEKDYSPIKKKISSVKDLLEFYNSFKYIDFKHNHVFIMREGVKPTWEDEQNRRGGICSFKTLFFNKDHENLASINVFRYLLLRVCGETLHTDINKQETITGISISPKIYQNNTKKITCIIKLWNNDSSDDLSKTMNKDVLNKYESLSIRYKPTEPEN